MSKKTNWFFNFLSFFFGLGVIGAMAVFVVVFYFYLDLPKIKGISDFNPPIPSQILSKDGEVLLESGVEQRDLAKISEIPDKIINSFLAAEDDNFYNHHGVDPMGIIRAMAANIRAGRIVQGGSTITQQVAKALYLSRERSVTRKIKDFLLAIEIEKKFSKDEILYLYLNEVYLGGGFYGIKAAFRGYFDKELADATIAESAMVAGLLVAPGRYSPYINPKYAKIRQGYVLKRLYETQKITKTEYEQSLNEPLKLKIRKSVPISGGHFTEWIRQRVVDVVGKEAFLRDGLKVVTTMNWKLQQIAEEQVKKGVKEVDKRQGFKGPLQSISSDEDIKDYLINYRKKLYKENSNYFYLNPDNSINYEIVYQEDEIDRIYETDDLFKEQRKSSELRADNSINTDDKFDDFLKKGETYLAVVTETDNSQRMIYVSVGGVKGIIPYEGFRWAHERVIDENKNLFPYVTRPSTILKKGDVVQVLLQEKNENLWNELWKGYKDDRVAQNLKKQFNEQRFHKFELDQEADVEGALVSMDVNSGHIISLVGGKDFNISQFNRAIQSKRQPGSSFKPILYAAALEKGFTPNHILIDSPEALGGVEDGLNWKPRNYDGKFKGAMTLRQALEQSRNVPTIKLAAEVKVDYIIDFVKRLGLEAELDQDLSLSLGSFGATLKDMVETYAIFANGGRKVKAKSILSVTDRYNKQYEITDFEITNAENESQNVNEQPKLQAAPELEALADNSPLEANGEEGEEEKQNPYLTNLNEKQVYDSRLAYIMTNLLRGVVQNGTGRRARAISNFIGGKTGTTNNYVDAWFIGFSPQVAVGTWIGFDDNKTLGWAESGSKAALPIWKEYMEKYLEYNGETDFKIPDGIVNVLLNRDSGKLAKLGDQNTILESFVKGTEPGAEVAEVPENQDEIKVQYSEDEEYYMSQ